MTVPQPTPAALAALNYDKLEALARRATPGPWAVEVEEPDKSVTVWRCDDAFAFVCRTGFQAVRSSDDDAAFIAACSPDVILALLAAARRGAGDTERIEHLERERASGAGEPIACPRTLTMHLKGWMTVRQRIDLDREYAARAATEPSE